METNKALESGALGEFFAKPESSVNKGAFTTLESFRIRNFQIIEKADILFDKPVTLVFGPSNSGKTSIIRALESLFYNRTGTDFIQVGKEKAGLRVKCKKVSDGVVKDCSVSWVKQQMGSATYVIRDGDESETYNKVGRSSVDEVVEFLEVPEVETTGTKERLNFSKQFSYPFLLNKTATQLFEFFSSSSHYDNLFAILKEMKRDYSSFKSDRKALLSSIDTLKIRQDSVNQELDCYPDYDLLVDYLKVMDKLMRYKSFLLKVEQLFDVIMDIEQRLSELSSEPLLQADFEVMEQQKSLGEYFIESYDKYLEQKKLHKDVKTLNEQIGTLDNIVKDDDMLVYGELYYATVPVFKNIKSVIVDIDEIDYQIPVYNSFIGDYAKFMNKGDVMYKQGSELASSCEDLITSIDSLVSDVKGIDAELLEIETEMDVFDVCPLCNSILK